MSELPTTSDGYIDTIAAGPADTLANHTWSIDEQIESIDGDSDFSEFSTTSSTDTRDIQREWDENLEQGRQLFAIVIFPYIGRWLGKKASYWSFLDHDSKLPPVIKPNKFIENEPFNSLVHDIIKQNLDKDPFVQAVLQMQLEGWTHITDYRNPAPYGRIPLPEDIFGSVQIVDGVIKSSTYERMPTHRIVSSNGLFQLSDYLHDKLLGYLNQH
ncbi:hypothetical protein BGZ76_001632 [Entomortierella beljakovae]|nr:hypothetical protein BGZ76_001632 [Entomortierella beljakovae]